MTDVNLITPAQERTLSGALVSAIQNVNSGMTPNEALAKSACDHGLTPQFACRMTEAYNASKTVKYLQSTEGEKRAENFDLADRDMVLKLMYAPETVKTASARGTTPALGKTYTVAPTTMKNLTKAACESTIMAEKLQDPAVKAPTKRKGPALQENKKTKLASLIARLDHAGAEIRMERANARDQAVKCACALESALRVPGHEPFEELEKRVVSTYGKLGKKAMDIVWAMTDFERLGEKRASAPDRLFLMGTGPAYDTARELMSWIEKAARLDTEMKDFEDKKRQVQKLLPEASGQQPGGTGATFVSDPGMPRRPATAPLVDVAKAIGEGASGKDNPEKTAGKDEGGGGGGFGSDPTGILGTVAGKPEPTSIFDPAQEGKIRAIRTKLVVNDMISNDPVLSAYPPEHVFNAYNDLSRMAPGVANEPVVVRSLIGRLLQTGGRMEPNEIKQLLDAEKAHREIRVKGF